MSRRVVVTSTAFWCTALAIALGLACTAAASPADYTIAPEILPATPFEQLLAVDLDGDGLSDLATGGIRTRDTRVRAWVAVYRKQGPLTYAPEVRFETGSNSTASNGKASCRILAVADLNHDSRLDLVVANDYAEEAHDFDWGTLAILLATPGFGFSTAVEYDAVQADLVQAVEVADFDADGSPDLLMSSQGLWGEASTRMFWNAGNGTFTAGATLSGGGAIASGDFDHNGKVDFACGRPAKWFPNLGARSFGIPVALGSVIALTARDLNNDGAVDLVADGAVFLQTQAGGFAPPVLYPNSGSRGMLCTDLDGNGSPDVVLAETTNCTILLNDGSGAFAAQSIPVHGDWRQVLAGNVCGDNRPDIVLRGPHACTVLERFGAGTTYRTLGAFAARFDPLSAALDDPGADGKANLLVGIQAASGGIAVLQGRADGTFFARRDLVNGLQGSEAEGFDIWRSAIADFDGDTHADVLLMQGSMLSILRGVTGTALFAPPEVYGATNFVHGPPSDLTLGDVDGNQTPDLVMVPGDTHEVSVVPNTGGVFQFAATQHLLTGATPNSVAAADFNGDGWCDVAANGWDRYVLVLQSLGPVGFAANPSYVDAGTAPQQVRAKDLDGDSRPDLIVTRALDTVVLWNLGASGFSAPVVLAAQRGIVTGDVTGDGAPDVLIANGVTLQVLANAGNRTFVPGPVSALGTAYGIELADLDGDGRSDLVVRNSVQWFQVLRNEGGGSFVVRDEVVADYGGVTVAVADLTGDGHADLLLGTSLFVNNIPPVTPVAVEDFAAHVDGASVRLEWRLSRDASTTLRGLQVERAALAGGPFERLTAVPLAPAPVMTYTDPDASAAGSRLWYRLVLLQPSGTAVTTTPVAVTTGTAAPVVNTLRSARQSADGEIEIHYALAPPGGTAQLSLFDVRGRSIRSQRIVGAVPGEHVQNWDSHDAGGVGLAHGVYFVRLECRGQSMTAKLVLVR